MLPLEIFIHLLLSPPRHSDNTTLATISAAQQTGFLKHGTAIYSNGPKRIRLQLATMA